MPTDSTDAAVQAKAESPPKKKCAITPLGVINAILAAALAGTAIWTAWEYGGGSLATRRVAALAMLGLLPLGLAAGCFVGLGNYRPPRLTLLAIAVWLVGMLQCVPLPESFVRVLSPASHEAYRQWLPESIRAEALESPDPTVRKIASRGIPISLAPTYTRIALAIPLTFAAACWLSSLCCAHHRLAIFLFTTTAVAGSAFAFFGLADAIRLARDSEVELRQRLFITPVGADGPFGPFYENFNGANYLNLAVGCALGLLVFTMSKARVAGHIVEQASVKSTSDDEGKSPDSAANPPGSRPDLWMLRHWQSIGCVTMITVMVAGVLGSGSRGAFVGLVAGTIVLAIQASRGRSRLRLAGAVTTIVTVTAIAVLMLGGLGLRDNVKYRLQTLYDGMALNNPRLSHWPDGLNAALEYLPAGAGFGAYRYAYLPFQRKTGGGWFVNADSMPLEWLVEGGVWLLSIVFAALYLFLRDVRRISDHASNLPSDSARVARALVTTSSFVVPAMLMSQCFTFSILMPPLVLTLALICGGVSQLASAIQRETGGEDRSPLSRDRKSLLGCVVTAVLLAGGLVVASADLHAGSTKDKLRRLRQQRSRVLLTDRPSYSPEIERLEKILARRPSDSASRQMLARLLIDEQRRLGAIYLLDTKSTDARSAGRWVSVRNARRAFYNVENRTITTAQELMLPPQDLRQWRRAREHAIASLVLCPLDDTSRVLLVELDFVKAGASEVTPTLLEQAAFLRRHNSRVLLYLQSLADTHPKGPTADLIRDLLSRLRR